MMWLFRLALIAVGVLAGPPSASAQFTTLQPSDAVAVSYTGPADIQASPIIWGSCTFAVSAAYATGSNVGCQYVRASDSHTCDTLITTAGGQGNTANCSTGGDNGQSLSSWLTSTTGNVNKIYDQSGALDCGGAACSPTNTASTHPSATLSAIGSLSAVTFTNAAATFLITGANSAAHAQPITCYLVAKPTGVSGSAQRLLAQGTAGTNPIMLNTAATPTTGINAGTTLNAATGASTNSWHVILGLYNGNGSNSVIAIDNTETTGAASTNGFAAGKLTLGAAQGGATANADMVLGEFGCWAANVSAGNRTSLSSNAHTRWGF